MHFNPRFLIQLPFGVLKTVEFVVSILVLICMGAGNYPGTGEGFVYFVAVGALITVLIFAIIYILGINDSVTFIPWQFIELVYCAVWGLFYFIAIWICMTVSIKNTNVINTNLHSAFGAATFFCVVAFIVFAVNFFLLFRGFRGGEFHYSRRQQTTHEATTTTTTVTTNKY